MRKHEPEQIVTHCHPLSYISLPLFHLLHPPPTQHTFSIHNCLLFGHRTVCRSSSSSSHLISALLWTKQRVLEKNLIVMRHKVGGSRNILVIFIWPIVPQSTVYNAKMNSNNCERKQYGIPTVLITRSLCNLFKVGILYASTEEKKGVEHVQQ